MSDLLTVDSPLGTIAAVAGPHRWVYLAGFGGRAGRWVYYCPSAGDGGRLYQRARRLAPAPVWACERCRETVRRGDG